jgi:hypothetical protein
MTVDEPGRHLARRDLLFDPAGPGPRVLVGDERHRRDRARTVAVLAGALEDRCDVFRKGYRTTVSGGGLISARRRKRRPRSGGNKHDQNEHDGEKQDLHDGAIIVGVSAKQYVCELVTSCIFIHQFTNSPILQLTRSSAATALGG